MPQTPDDVAYQLYSSGTTGLPKGVQLTNRNLFSAVPMYQDVMELRGDAVNLVAMPLFHIGGGGWALAGMTAGVPGVLLREVDPAKVVDAIEAPRRVPRVPRASRAAVHAHAARRRRSVTTPACGTCCTGRHRSRPRC